MEQSENIKTLLENLVNAQAEFVTLPKDKNGYNYKYTDLDTVISSVKPIFAKHKLAFMQSLTTLENGKWAMTTRIFNAAGEWIEDTTPLPDVSLTKGNAAQNVGAAITYMKRYTLCAMLGISSDEDPDGKPDGNIDFNSRKESEPKVIPTKPVLAGGDDTPEEKARIKELLNTTDKDGKKVFEAERQKILEWRKNRTAAQVIEWLEGEAKKRAPFPEDIPWDNNSGKENPQTEIF